MNIEQFRDICLSLKGAAERMPFKEKRYSGLVAYCIGDKWFGLVDTDNGQYCNLKCDPDLAVELRDRYNGISPAWHMNKRHWNLVAFDSDVPDSLFISMIEMSYDLVLRSLPKKKRAEISDGL